MGPLVKICGLSSVETVEAAVEAGADRIGLVFFPKSPRHVTLGQAAALAARARGAAVVVALTVDADDDFLADMVAAVRPDMIQLHGRETDTRVCAIRARFGLPAIKVVGVSSASDLAVARTYAAVADEIMFDAKPPEGAARPGGNGVAFDWTILSALDLPVPFMLSGGLDADNVRHALALTGAPAVDVSSGVETAPGMKSADKIRAFIRAARPSA